MNKLRNDLTEQKHHAFRKTLRWNLAEEYREKGLSAEERMTDRFERLCRAQTPVFLPGETICFLRTAVLTDNEVFTPEEWGEIRKSHYVHEAGYHSNLSPNYEEMIRDGLLAHRDSADKYGRRCIDALLELTQRYRLEALRLGKDDTAAVLQRVPAYGAETFREALQSFRIIHFGLWLENNYHITIGRFDQYLYPYLQKDLAEGRLDRAQALELLEDFFLSFNKDSDLYFGVQQGDNGQSMVLGGMTDSGEDGFNLLSELCLIASNNLRLIDPKINLRVSAKTPQRVFELGSQLTKAGLGFPQYSNDDVVIPALEALGYEPQDALNYVVAACWEFIIPKVGADIANIGAISLPACTNAAIEQSLKNSESFDEMLGRVRDEIFRRVEKLREDLHNVWFVPSPFMNVCMNGMLKHGAKYNNFGIHGTGIATAADSLAAVQKYVYDEKSVDPTALCEAVASDFEEHPELLPILRFEAPKMGQDEELPDSLAVTILRDFSDAFRGCRNDLGGIYRPGTGSAMYYLWHADELGASFDGRRAGEPFGTNFSPSLFAKIPGPFSVIRSFTKPDFSDCINGGPLTLEFHHSMFSAPDCIPKIAGLVQTFMRLGGHQLQLNAVNPEEMRDAQIHPERHRQLVVRIWGWSAYFVELDRAYQDHVLARQEYTV